MKTDKMKITENIKNLFEATSILMDLENPEYLEANGISEDEVPEFKKEIEKQIASCEAELWEQLNRLSFLRQQNQILANGYLEESLRLKQLADGYDKKVKRIENTMDYLLKTFKKSDFNTDLYKLSYRKSESVEITNENALPKEFIKEKITTAPDKVAIKDALKNWVEVPWASIITKQNLQIK